MSMKLSVFNLIKSSIILLTVWILVFGLSQLSVSAEFENTNCILAPGHSSAVCRMNPLEHIQEWQNMFTAIPNPGNILLLSLILSLFLIIFRFTKYLNYLNEPDFYKKILFIPQKTKPIINFLEEAFSNGILNPKIF